jgi:uncharacterized hydrophobic protein (TIGR00341 family)
MRIVRTLIDEDNREAVVSVLEDENIDYVVSEEVSERGELLVVEFPVPEEALEVVLDRFDEVGHEEHAYTVVAEATSALSENIGEIEDRFVVGEEEDSSIAQEELRSKALQQVPNRFSYYLLTFLSAVVATAGLLLDAPALVVGSMVIAPLVGAALTASVGTVLTDSDMILSGFKKQVGGLGIAILGSVAFGALLRSGILVPPSLEPSTTGQIAKRISPGLPSLVIGVCAGVAGAVGIATGISAALVGVMIAAALIPAAAAVGIGIVWGVPAIGMGALILLVVNAASIHVSGVATFWAMGYRPDAWTEGDLLANLSLQDFAPSLAVGVVLAVLFVVAGGAVSTHIAFERSANLAVENTLDEGRYETLELVGVSAEFNQEYVFDGRQTVTVTVRRPAAEEFPELSRQVRQRIADRTGRNPVVVVEFVEGQRAPPSKRDAGAIQYRFGSRPHSR